MILDWPKWLGTAAVVAAEAEDMVVDEADEADEVGEAVVDSLLPTQHHWDEAAGDFSIYWGDSSIHFLDSHFFFFQRPLSLSPQDTR